MDCLLHHYEISPMSELKENIPLVKYNKSDIGVSSIVLLKIVFAQHIIFHLTFKLCFYIHLKYASYKKAYNSLVSF